MDSDYGDPKGPGFPIRISTDQSLFAAPHGFSQRTTSFIASRCQGIHQTPLRRLIDPTSNGQHPVPRSTRRSPEDRTSSALYYPVSTTERSNGPARTPLAGNPQDRARPVITSSPCPTASTRDHPPRKTRAQHPVGSTRPGISAFRDRAGAPSRGARHKKNGGPGKT